MKKNSNDEAIVTRNNKIRILHIVGDSYGGVERVVENYYRYTDKNRYIFDIIYHGQEDEFTFKMSEMGSYVMFSKKLKTSGVIKYVRSIISIIGMRKYDIIQVHSLQHFLIYLYVAKKLKISKTIVHIHNTYYNPTRSLLPFLVKLQIKFAVFYYRPLVMSCANFNVNSYLSKKVDRFILNNAIDLEQYIPDKASISELTHKYGLKGKKIIGHVGHFVKQKNHDFILEIAKKLDSESIILLFGKGPLKDEIESRIVNEKIKNVIVIGFRNDISKLYSMFDLVILPSLHEGFPIVSIESQLCNINMIASDLITREIELVNGKIDFLPIDDIDSWVRKINLYLSLKDYAIDNINLKTYNKSVLIKKGFEINEQSKILQSQYDSLVRTKDEKKR